MRKLGFFCTVVIFCVFAVQQTYASEEISKGMGALHEEVAFTHPDEQWLNLAVQATSSQNFDKAIEYYKKAALSDDEWISWAGVSGQVAVYRMSDQPKKAFEVTSSVVNERPELAGLMLIWDADTLGLNENAKLALATYQKAVDDFGHDNIDGEQVGALALKQLSFAYLNLGLPLDAAQSLRKMLLEFPTKENPDLTVAEIFTYEALANSPDFSIYSFGTLAETGLCTPQKPCVVDNNFITVPQELPKDAEILAQVESFYFVLSSEQREFLDAARTASESKRETSSNSNSGTSVCTPSNASDGFQKPYSASFSGYGDIFMSYPAYAGGYHPGVDINTANDCNDNFLATARGCVTEVAAVYPTLITSTWGTMTVKHYYYPAQSSSYYWTSQYGHGDKAYFSVGSAVTKGVILGEMDDVPDSSDFSCHLHFEIREANHPAKKDADYWNASSKTNVGNYYQDPESFISSHTKYTKLIWGDENHFTTYGTTAWSSSSTVGDEDTTITSGTPSTDMKYVTRASTKTAYARTFFTPSSSGTYSLYVFIPWSNATSKSVPVKLVKNSNGQTIITASVNQLYGSTGTAGYGCGWTNLTPSWVTYSGEVCDEWLRVGSASLSSGTQYYVEVANNTGESSSTKIGLDDILIIKQ